MSDTLNLNHVKSIKAGNTELKVLSLGSTTVWRKVTGSISITNITGGKRISFTKIVSDNESDPLQHYLYTKKSASDNYSSSTSYYDIKTASTGTAHLLIGQDTSHPIYEETKAWEVTAATAPSVSVSNITGGKRYIVTNNMSTGTCQYSTDNISWNDIDNNTFVDLTTSFTFFYVRVIDVTGYANSLVDSADGVSKASAPTISSWADYISTSSFPHIGGKKVTITNNASSGTVQYRFNNSSWTNGTTCIRSTAVTNGYVYARVVNVTGYANSDEKKSSAVTIYKLSSPTVNSWTDITGGKSISFTNQNTYINGSSTSSVSGSTLYVSKSQNSGYSAGTSISYTTVTTNGYAYGFVSKSGYETSSLTTSASVNVYQLSAPTSTSWTATTNGKQIVFTNPNTSISGSTMTLSGGTSRDSTTVYAIGTAGTYTASAYISKVGYVNSSTVSISTTVYELSKPIFGSWTDITGGKRISVSADYTCTNGNTLEDGDPTLHVSKYENAGYSEGTSISYTTVTTNGYAYAYESLDGYVNSDIQKSSSVTVTKLAVPTISVTNITGGKKIIITNNNKIGTLYYLYRGSTYSTLSCTSSNYSVTSSDYTSVINGTAKAYVSCKGYVDSEESSSSWSVTKATLTSSNIDISNYLNGTTGGKRIVITNPYKSGTLHYLYSGSTYSTLSCTSSNYSVTSSPYTSVTSGTAKAYLTGVSGYADMSSSDNISTAWSVTQLDPPSISKASITGGIYINISNTNNIGTLHYLYSGDTYSDTTESYVTSSNYTTITSGTAKALVYCSGYVTSERVDYDWSVGYFKPVITTKNHSSGGKYFSISSPGSGTINFEVSGGLTQTSTGTSTNRWANTTATTCIAWCTGAKGYVNGSKSVANSTVTNTTTLSIPSITISVNNITGGKNITVTNTCKSGTLYYLYSGSTYSTLACTSSNYSVVSSNYTSVTSGTARAYVINVPGYADMSSSNSVSTSWSVTALASPTINTKYDISSYNKRTFRISSSSSSTLYVSWTNGTPTSVGTYYSDHTSTSVESNTAKAYCVQAGYVNSSTVSFNWVMSRANVPTMSSTATEINKRTFRISSDSSSILFVNWENGTPTSTNTYYSNKEVTSTSSLLEGTAKAYCQKKGFIDSNTQSFNWALTKLTVPTISVSNITGGKRITFNQTQSGTLYYLDSGSSYSSTAGASISVDKKTVSSGTAKAYVTKVGYITSDTASTTWEVTQLAAPTINRSKSLDINSRTFRIQCISSSSTLYVSWTNGTPASTNRYYSDHTSTSVESNTAKAYSSQVGYVNSSTVSFSWAMTQLTVPTIYVNSVTGGKTLTFSQTQSGTLYYRVYSSNNYSSTGNSSYTTPSTINVVSSGTAQAYVTKVGYITSNTASTAWEVTKLSKPSNSITTSPGAITYSIVCSTSSTLYVNWTNGTPTSINTYHSEKTISAVSNGTAKAYCTQNGYVNSDEISFNWSITKAPTPTWSSSNISGGKRLTLTNNTSILSGNNREDIEDSVEVGTLQYKIGSGSWNNYVGSFDCTTANTVYGRVVNAYGYVNSDETASISVQYATVPTITASATVNPVTGRRKHTITTTMSGTLKAGLSSNVLYTVNSGSSYYAANGETIYVQLNNVSGYANVSTSKTSSVTGSDISTARSNSGVSLSSNSLGLIAFTSSNGDLNISETSTTGYGSVEFASTADTTNRAVIYSDDDRVVFKGV